MRDGEELWSITREGGDERKVADLKPLHPIGNFSYELQSEVSGVSPRCWLQFIRR